MAFDEVGMLDENDFVGALSLGGRGGIIIIGCEEMTAELGAQIAKSAGDYNGAAIAAAHDYARVTPTGAIPKFMCDEKHKKYSQMT